MHKNIKMLQDTGWFDYFNNHYDIPMSNLILDIATHMNKEDLCSILEVYSKHKSFLNKTVAKPEQDSKIDDVRVDTIKIGDAVFHVKETCGGDDYWIKEKPMAKLSEKITLDINVNDNTKQNEEKTMSKLRTVNITLIDENPNLKGDNKVVFQKMGVVTEYNDQETKMNVIASGKVAKALQQHNSEVREQTIDKGIQRTTGRDVMLEPIELLSDGELTWSIIQVA